MKVCQQRIDHSEIVRRINENIRAAKLRLDATGIIRGRLKHAHARSANRDNPPPLGFCLINGPGGGGVDVETLLVHRVILDVIALHRLKRSGPDV